jgi:hypothetical protein
MICPSLSAKALYPDNNTNMERNSIRRRPMMLRLYGVKGFEMDLRSLRMKARV